MENQNKFEKEIALQNKIEGEIAFSVHNKVGTAGLAQPTKTKDVMKEEIIKKNYLPEEWQVGSAVDRVYEIFLTICKEESIKVEKLYKKEVGQIKKKRMGLYLIFMIFAGILVFISFALPFSYSIQRGLLIGFIFALLYPFYAWIRDVIRLNK